jgi:hypothetical protein
MRDYTVRTRVRGGEDACRRCAWDEAGGQLGMPHPPSHSCRSNETAIEYATRSRQAQLDRINNRATRQRTR